MSRHAQWVVSLLCLAGVAACDCGGTKFDKRGNTTLTIDSPATGDIFATLDTVTFQATGVNPAGIAQVVLSVGKKHLATCDVGDDDSKIVCSGEFLVKDMGSEIVNGQLVLAAVARDGTGMLTRQSVTIEVRTLRVRFLMPMPDEDDESKARVSGSTRAIVGVLSAAPIQRVAVTFDDGLPSAGRVATWSGNAGETEESGEVIFTSPQTIPWAQLMGTGVHKILAQAQDDAGNVSSATLDLEIRCKKDSECPSDSRCCAEKGTCNPMVGSGEDCDCEHPCPTSQGCFPGTCGETPYKCRPGCYPGDSNTKADRCSPTSTLVVTYCSALPPDQRTEENLGGACAPGDNCSVVQQNCPNLPIDRTQPVSAANPAVPHTCVPVSPYATACRPAGTKKLGQQNCHYDTCGDSSNGCEKGLICTGVVGQPNIPTTCNKQCSNPGGFGNECGTFGRCQELYGPGLEKVKTGVCQ